MWANVGLGVVDAAAFLFVQSTAMLTVSFKHLANITEYTTPCIRTTGLCGGALRMLALAVHLVSNCAVTTLLILQCAYTAPLATPGLAFLAHASLLVQNTIVKAV
jgi:hypothetical protein